jgi:3-oxosteroid 1-dehydrogenase
MSRQTDQAHDDRQTQFRVSRRSFLRAAGAGAALAGAGAANAGIGVLPFSASRASAQGAWDQEVDIVVVGSGAAALAAAVTAQSLGNEVVVLEKAETIGGTTGKSGGVYWVPNNSVMNAEGLTDPKEDALRYMVRVAYPQLYSADDPTLGLSQELYDLMEAFYDRGPEAVDALAEMGALQSTLWMVWDGQPGPDYYAQYPENQAPRGRALGPLTPEDSRGNGAELIRQLQAKAEEVGIPLQTGHRVVSLVQNDQGEVIGIEAVIGAEAESGQSERLAVRARKAVVFGSGGFTHNPEMRVNYLRGPIFGGCAVPTNEGDFVNIGIAAGAALGNMANAFWAQVPLEQALDFSSTPSDVFSVPGDSMILVNKYGRRVVNEKIQYNERTQVHFVWDPVVGEFPNLFLIMIYDQRTADLRGGAYPIPAAEVEAPYVVSGETWDELAQNLEERVASLAPHTGGAQLSEDFATNLAETVERFNGFALAGVDEDFNRGIHPIEIAFHGPPAEDSDLPNSTMFPLADMGPYHAILIGGGTLDTKGGPKVNAMSQVVSTEGEVIPGLYGAGNCIASLSGQAYWAAGGTLGPALTFGYLAGLYAAEEPVRDS